MEVKHGNDKTEYGPGVQINLSGDEVAIAISAYLVSREVYIHGPRTIRINGEKIENGGIYVDPIGGVIYNGNRYSGRGQIKEDE